MTNQARSRLVSSLDKFIFFGLLLVVVVVPLIYHPATTQVWGLIKIVATEVLAVVISGFWLLRLNHEGSLRFSFTPLGLPVTVFFSLSALSLIFSTNIWEGLLDLSQLAAYVLLFFLAANNLNSKKRISSISIAATVTAFSSCLYSIYRDQGPYIFTALRQTYISTFGHPMFFAEYLIAVIPVGCVLFLVAQNRILKSLLGLMAVTLLFFLALTKTRGAWVGVFFGFLVMLGLLILHARKNKSNAVSVINRRHVFVISASILVLIAGMSVFSTARVWQKEVIERIYSTFSPGYVTNAMRLNVWGNTLRMVKDHPVRGVGIGNFRVVYPAYRSIAELSLTPEGQKYSNTHNDLLQILSETGAVGLLVFIWLVITALRVCLRILRDSKERYYAFLIIGITGSVCATLAHAFFSSNLRVPSSAMMFWVWLGVAGAIYKNEFIKPRSLNERKRPSALKYSAVLLVVVFLASVLIYRMALPLASDIYFKKGQSYSNDNRNLEAVTMYEKAASLFPGNYEPYFMLGNSYQKLGMFPEAFIAYEKASKLNPYDPLISNNLGTIFYRNRQYDKAAAKFEKAVKINPRYFGARYNLYLLYTQTGKSEEAQRQLAYIMEFKPEFMGNILMKQRNYAAAILAYKKAAEIEPNSEQVHMNLGMAYQESRLNDEATAEFREVIRINPSNLGAYRHLGFLLLRDERKYNEAADIYRRIIRFVPGDIAAHYNLGTLYVKLKDYNSARREFEEIISLNPRDPAAYVSLGDVFDKLNNWDEAIRVLKESLRLAPDSKEAKDLLNSVYLKKMNGG